METVRYEVEGPVAVVTIDRPEVRNAVDPATASALVEAFGRFDAAAHVSVAILTGARGTFCAGFDLKSLARGGPFLSETGPSPMGPARMQLGKPVIAAVEGYAVGGGFELALWCDLRVAARGAVVGVFNRRFGVPLVDGGTVRLPRLVGQSRAMDLILTGRGVPAEEAFDMGLVNRLAEPGEALEVADGLARDLARLPQGALRNDRLSALEQWGLSYEEAMRNEFRHGMESMSAGRLPKGPGVSRRGRAGTANREHRRYPAEGAGYHTGVERMDLRVGEERAVHLPPGDWTVRVEGMSSAISARKLWPADPYPDDDEDDQAPRPPPDVVFMIRGTAPGTATLRFEPVGGRGGSAREIRLEVRL